MPIPASYIVAINPRLIPAGGNDLEFNGLLLSDNPLIPRSAPVLQFYNNSFAKPRHLMIGRRVKEAVGAYLRGAQYTGTLASLKLITAGTLTVEINGADVSVSDVDLSAATSYSDVATAIQTALQAELAGVTVAYSSLTGAFQINGPSTSRRPKARSCPWAPMR